jgi:Fe-Mn family superoxide dismutase
MAPNGKGGGGEPKGAVADKIVEDFGSFAAFKAQFTEAAKSVEGSGWASLAYRKTDGRLLVLQYENHQKLSTHDTSPVLAVDVWEHAYYLKYQNKRDEYINAWWNVVNWDAVAANVDKLK